MDFTGTVRVSQPTSFPAPGWGGPGSQYNPAGPGVRVLDTPGEYTFVTPYGATSLQVECWGAAGGGGTGAAGDPGGGGGGGTYGRSVLTAPLASAYAVVVPAGLAPGGAFDFTRFGGTVVVAGSGFSAEGGTGGESSIAFNVSQLNRAGGKGSDFVATSGGGGGSSAGPDAAGVAATATATGAVAPDGGGSGGNGSIAAVGLPGLAPGGGGGGGGLAAFAGGQGGPGQVRITWPAPG